MKARAPYRVSMFGGGSDYPAWYTQRRGVIVNFALDAYVTVDVQEHGDKLTRIACANSGKQAVSITSESEMPAESGVGGSAAYTTALLYALHGGKLAQQELLWTAFRLEGQAGRVIGVQDLLASIYGGFKRYILEWRGHGLHIEQIPFELSAQQQAELCACMCLVYAKRVRSGGSVAAQYHNRVDMAQVVELAHLGGGAIDNQDWPRVGCLLGQAWALKAQWAQEISTQEVNQVIAQAMRMGAWGAKLLGAGGGGHILIMADPVRIVEICDKFGGEKVAIAARGVSSV